MIDLTEIHSFLPCTTPEAWLNAAPGQLNTLLIDHANCEKKAASTALHLLYRYIDRTELLAKLSQLAREELLHFEQVVALMRKMGMTYRRLSPSRYASELRSHVRKEEPLRLLDILISGAYIEARSCERFAALATRLLEEKETRAIGHYYRILLKSERRHYTDYLALARLYAAESIEERVAWFGEVERELILSPDAHFRFHSGVPR
jgi:tRNA-(ms[2]io[6]A)-hydroxylase